MASNPLETYTAVTALLDDLTKENGRLRTMVEAREAALRNLLDALKQVSDGMLAGKIDLTLIPTAIAAGWAVLGEKK